MTRDLRTFIKSLNAFIRSSKFDSYSASFSAGSCKMLHFGLNDLSQVQLKILLVTVCYRINIHTRRFLWHSPHSSQKFLLQCSIYKLQAKNSGNFVISKSFECTPYVLANLQGIFKDKNLRCFRQATSPPDCIPIFTLPTAGWNT